MTRAFWILCLTCLSILFIGLLNLNGGMLILLLPLLVYLAAAIWHSPAAPQLRLTRSLSQEKLNEGASLQVQLEIVNEGQQQAEVEIREWLPAGIIPLQGVHQSRVKLPEQARISLEYTLQPRRGKYRFGSIQASASDPFGLFSQAGEFSDPVPLTVFPAARPLRYFQIRPRQTRGFAGPIPARRGGSGSNFFGLRDYQPGDPTRRINWLASSRHEETLFTNEFEQESFADVGVILDALLSVNLVGGGLSLFEHSVMATAALAETLLKQGHRVSLLSFGQGLQRVFPGYGKVQLQRMLNILSQIKPGTNYALESIKNLPTSLFSASSQLIIITPLTREDQEGLIGLCAQGYNVLVLCPRIPEAEIPVGADILPQALRLKKVERRMLIHRLSRAGIQIAEWPVEIPLENALRQVSGLAAQRSRGQTRSV